MKKPTPASLKKVTPENLAALGVERLAQIVAEAAETRPELKRRLRMELAAAQGSDQLAVEIDRRLASLQSSRSRVSWRKRPSFVADLEALRGLIAERLAALDPAMALDRMWAFMDLAAQVSPRVSDKHGELAAVFARGAEAVGALTAAVDRHLAAGALAEALARSPTRWSDWLPAVLARAPDGVAAATLTRVQAMPPAGHSWPVVVRLLADASGDVEAFAATYSPDARRAPAVAAALGRRLLDAGRVEEAGRVLEAARPESAWGRTPEPDFEWEGVVIDYLERAGEPEKAQAARWTSFERTLSVERAKAFVQRLGDFDDVEAEGKAFAYASAHADAMKGLRFLMAWPALPEAARMIEGRKDELRLTPEEAEAWAAKLRARQPAAAQRLLRIAAAAAFKRRDFRTSQRLTEEADALALG